METLYYNNENEGSHEIYRHTCKNCGGELRIIGIPTRRNTENLIELPVPNDTEITCQTCNTMYIIEVKDHDIGIECTFEEKIQLFGDLSEFPLIANSLMIK